ncbi:chemotaxis protein CheA [Sphingomonas sp. TZW2008]|uniref:chemotaxis protein CheA n=1 Tax=Sphingomonas sp. TZW2008 TaxID=1917973 RepID=UPI000A271AAA|nr:chemotaxis protein CheW [Sphingomonas sp. TZW2008]
MDDLLQEFIAETRETLAAISGEIVAWEADPADRSRLDSIFRFVHTVKGSCGFLDLPRLARLSHAAEDVLQSVRSGDRAPDTQLVNAVLAIIDRIGEIVEAIDAGVALDDSSEDLLLAALAGEPTAPIEAKRAPSAAPRAPVRSIRLSVDLLDRMMSGMSEMVLARNDLARRLRETGDPALEAAVDRLSLTVAELRDTVTRTRMQAIDALFSPLPRLVRDTAAQLGKKVTLTVNGGDVELDREMIELLRDPLVHMVRNAIDHGIETPEERRRSGKPEAGRLTIAARQSGNQIIVEITDDGRGIDTERLVAKRMVQEPARAAALNALGERERLELVFEPGLSTRDEVTALSGRGVGMDVVRTNVEQIGGSIRLSNTVGRGLIATIAVPLTLSILSAIVIEAGGGRYAVPRQMIEEIVAVGSSTVRIDQLGDGSLATVRDRRLPLVSFNSVIGVGAALGTRLMIVNLPSGSFALAVDAVIDAQELVVKPAAPAVMAAGIYAGQMLLETGEPLLLVDCSGVASVAGVAFDAVVTADEPEEEAVAQGLSALMFVALDGERRLIALDAVDRIEPVPVSRLSYAGDRWWASDQSATIPLIVDTPPPAEALSMLLLHPLHERAAPTGYLIRAASDIVNVAGEIVPIDAPGAMIGVAVIEGKPIEIVDPRLLLPTAVRPSTDRPICLIEGEAADAQYSIVRRTIEAAGYRVDAAAPALGGAAGPAKNAAAGGSR